MVFRMCLKHREGERYQKDLEREFLWDRMKSCYSKCSLD